MADSKTSTSSAPDQRDEDHTKRPASQETAATRRLRIEAIARQIAPELWVQA